MNRQQARPVPTPDDDRLVPVGIPLWKPDRPGNPLVTVALTVALIVLVVVLLTRLTPEPTLRLIPYPSASAACFALGNDLGDCIAWPQPTPRTTP